MNQELKKALIEIAERALNPHSERASRDAALNDLKQLRAKYSKITPETEFNKTRQAVWNDVFLHIVLGE